MCTPILFNSDYTSEKKSCFLLHHLDSLYEWMTILLGKKKGEKADYCPMWGI